jgi:uncharacterized membrane protein YqjE
VETAQIKQGMGGASKRVAQRVIALLENRFCLFTIELQEEREMIMRSLFLATCVGVCGLLACVTVTALITVVFWDDSPVGVLAGLAGLYTCVGVVCYILLLKMRRDWKTIPATLDQLKKDRECLEKSLV